MCSRWALGLLALLAVSSTVSARSNPLVVASPTSSESCSMCLTAVHVIEDFLCDPASTDFLVRFAEEHICPAVQIVADTTKCKNLAEGLIPVMVQYIRASTTPAQLCSATGACGESLAASKMHNQPALRAPKDTTECSMCKFVISRAKAALNDTTQQEAIKDEALKVCASLPAELAAGCTDFVNTYEPLITNFINTADPDGLCKLIGACMAQALAEARPLPPLPQSLITALATMQVAPQAHALLAVTPPSQLGFGDSCDVCKMAVVEAHSLVANPVVQADLVNYTKVLCETMGDLLSDACKMYVDDYAPIVFDMVEKYLTPDELCAELGICPTTSTAAAIIGSKASALGSYLGSLLGLRPQQEMLGAKYGSASFRAYMAKQQRRLRSV